MKIYLLSHTRNEEELDGYKVIGLFSSKEEAQKVVETLKGKPGFKDYPDNFHLGGYEVDQPFWLEGFG